MWVKGVLSLTQLQSLLVVLSLFSDLGTDLGFNLPVPCRWSCLFDKPSRLRAFGKFKILFIVSPSVV